MPGGVSRGKLRLRWKLAWVLAAALAPMAAALVAAAAGGGPPFVAEGLGAAILLSAALAWRVGLAVFVAPLSRLYGSLGEEAAGGAEPVAEIGRSLAALRAELETSRDEAASAALARSAAEKARDNSVDVLRSMVSTLPVGVVALGRDGRVTLWNHAAEAILGYSAAEMIGRPTPTDIFAASAGGSAAADVFLRMVTGQRVSGEEVQCRRKDGVMVDASFSGAALLGDEERLRGAICIFEDIGQRKAIAAQLQQAQKMEAVGQLTGGLAHDFNNILGIAIGNLDLLQADLEDRPAARDMVETALSALLRGAELTRALLAFARRQPLKPARVDAGALLATVIRMLARALGEHIQINLRVDGELWPVLADAAQLEAAITNLAINARDAMPQGGTLTVSARNGALDEGADVAAGDYLVIELSDTGAGMPPEVVARVFEPFFTTKAVGRGTGLGLSMVYGFIKQSGGHIKVYSEPGHGTTVRLYLPRAAEGGVAGRAAAASEPPPRGHERVLLVEDNAEVRRMVAAQLERLGYAVEATENGPAALALLDAGRPVDLLFTDVVMPGGMNGFELASAARELRPALKVLVTSGFPGTCLPSGGGDPAGPGFDFLGKPYRHQDLARAVREVLDKGATT